jgi:hypothetical protein
MKLLPIAFGLASLAAGASIVKASAKHLDNDSTT